MRRDLFLGLGLTVVVSFKRENNIKNGIAQGARGAGRYFGNELCLLGRKKKERVVEVCG